MMKREVWANFITKIVVWNECMHAGCAGTQADAIVPRSKMEVALQSSAGKQTVHKLIITT